jgi:hypothetical protein
MRRTLILSSLALISSISLAAQTVPAPAAPAPAAPPPAAPRPVARAPVQARPVTLTVQVTDTLGTPLGDTKVTITGPLGREGVTIPDGSLRFLNMRAGTYRLRFTREGSTTLERDITIRAGEPLTADVSLTPAPPPPKAPEPVKPAPEPATKALPPPGDPKSHRCRHSSRRTSSADERGARTLRLAVQKQERRRCTSFATRGLRTRTTTRMNGSMSWRERDAAVSAPHQSSVFRPARSAWFRTGRRTPCAPGTQPAYHHLGGIGSGVPASR